MNIESMAVTAVKSAISKTDYLVENIHTNDKEPSWDGSIFVYKNPGNNHRKEDYKFTVPVQVKGTETNDHSKETIKFRVDVVDLMNYRKIGGTIFYVVYISSDGEHTKIYFNPLLPFELNKILKNVGKKKSVLIEFSAFPTEKSEITNVVMNFARDMERQELLRYGEYNMEHAAKHFDLSTFQYGFSYTGLGYNSNNPADYVLNHDLYLYAYNSDETINIVIDHLNKADIVAEKLNRRVCVGGRQFYSEYIVKHTREGREIQIGKSVIMKLKDDRASLQYTLSGNLEERILDMEFMLAIYDEKCMYINDLKLPFVLTKKELESFHVAETKVYLEHLKNVRDVLKKIGVIKVLDVDNLTDKDDDYIKMLIVAFKHNKPVSFSEDNIPPVVPIKISNLKILLVFKPTGIERQYELYNFFGNTFEVVAQNTDGEMMETSHYTILEKDSFIEISNLNIDDVVTDLCLYNNSIHYDRANLCALDMISAYDICKNPCLLEAAAKIEKWLMDNNKASEDLYRINLYQTYLRQRKLSIEEKKNIYDLLEKYKNDYNMLAGLLLILGEKEEAEKIIQQLSETDRELFKTFPIYKLVCS